MPLEALALLFDLDRTRRALLVADRPGLVLPALARPCRSRGTRRGRPAPGHARRRLRADGGGRPLDLPLADQLAALGHSSGRRRRPLWALLTPAPDLIVTGDGRHLALRTADGRLAILRARAGDYVRDTLAEASGAEPDFLDLESLPEAACSDALCTATLERNGRRWRLLATRSRHLVAWPDMVRACAEADIIIADRDLPRGCTPRWLRADRALLRQTGGLSIRLGVPPAVATVAERVGRHPWAAR